MKAKLFLLYIIVVIINFTTTTTEVEDGKNKVELKEETVIEEKVEVREAKSQVEVSVTIEGLSRGMYKVIDLVKLSEVQPIEKNNVPRVVYSVDDISLRGLKVPQRKKLFFEIMVPTAMIVVEEIEIEREKIKEMIDGKRKKDEVYLAKKYKKYRVSNKNIVTLYKKMKPVPISILLSQGILESGWGTSRFFEDANNVFGVWSVDPTEPRIKAGEARINKQVYLRKYPTLKESMADYMRLLARHKAYSEFRRKLQFTNNYKILVPRLDKYSEMGDIYTDRLLDTIRYNKLYEYDHYEFK